MKLKPIPHARPRCRKTLPVADLLGVVSGQPTIGLAGVAAGLSAAAVLRVIRRVRRLLVSAAVLALAGGAGAGGVSELVHTVAGWR